MKPRSDPSPAPPQLIQSFIDTGEVPVSYRVLLLFGEPLYCMIFRQHHPRVSLDASDRELLETRIASNAGEDYVHMLVDDPEVLAFARRFGGQVFVAEMRCVQGACHTGRFHSPGQ